MVAILPMLAKTVDGLSEGDVNATAKKEEQRREKALEKKLKAQAEKLDKAER